MTRLLGGRVLLALALSAGSGCSQDVSREPLIDAAQQLEREVVVAKTVGDDVPEQLAARYEALWQSVRVAEGAWSARTVGDAWFAMYCCGVNLHIDPRMLAADLEQGIERIRSRPKPWHGLPRLLLTLTEVRHENGTAVPLAPIWAELGRWQDEPKKPWLCAEAARSLINRCKAPEQAVLVADEGLRVLDALGEWDESTRLGLIADPDVWITMSERPKAASATDCRGYLLLVRGFAQLSAGHLHEALADLLAAREPLQATGNTHRLTNVDHELAGTWLQLGRSEQAIECAARAERQYVAATWVATPRRPDENGVQAMRKVKARALARRGLADDLQQARHLLEQLGTSYFLAHPGETNVDALLVWGEILISGQGAMPAADEQRLGEVLRALRAHCEPRADLVLLAQAELLDAQWALRKDELDSARVHLEQVLGRLQGQRHLSLLVRHQCLTGHLHLAAGKPRDALIAYQRSSQLVNEAVERERLWAFDAGIGSYQQLHDDALRGAFAAFYAIARGEAVAGLEALQLLYGIVQQFHGYESACLGLSLGTKADESLLPPEARAAIERLRTVLRDGRARVQRIGCETVIAEMLRDRDLTRLQKEIDASEILIAAHCAVRPEAPLPTLVSLAEVQSALQPGELLVECIDLGTHFEAFCIDAAGATVQPLANGPALAAAADACTTWSHGDTGDVDAAQVPALAAAAGLVIPRGGWFAGRLAEPLTRTLLLSLEGALCRVPFAALPCADGQPLVERVAVAHVVSGTMLVTQRRDRGAAAVDGATGTLLALGNPHYSAVAGANGVAPLPWSAREVLDVARVFAELGERPKLSFEDAAAVHGVIAGRRFRVLLGDAARESALTPEALRGVRFLHFACHGTADVASPALSFLALSLANRSANGDYDEGLLRLGEFARLRGDYELLALSACETGRGVIRGHEGPASMARAGQAAGARRVLSTLWRVGDANAGELVVAFYSGWLDAGEPVGAALALARAQRDAIRRQVPVRDWAAFQLWGEAR